MMRENKVKASLKTSDLKETKSEFLIWSHKRSSWWKPNCCGYTNDKNYAGIYSFEEAVEICDEANFDSIRYEPNESMIPIVNKKIKTVKV